MKALTICQPYAHLIVRGTKRVENRKWPTRYRGPLAIHAGKSRDWLHGDEASHLSEAGDPLAFGAVVGTATLVDVLHISQIERGECDSHYPWLREHAHTEGPWCWVLHDVRRLAPIPWRGAQGLWNLPDAVLATESNPVVCELCSRVCDVDEDRAFDTDWQFTLDGWLCPACASTFGNCESDTNSGKLC